MRIRDSIIAYDANLQKVKVGPFVRSGELDWTKELRSWVSLPKELTSEHEVKSFVLSTFVGLVVRDGIKPETVHAAFLAIDEYREAIPPDVQGAD